MHKNLRRNKPGIRLKDVRQPPEEYHPPPGFSLVPSIIRGQPSKAEQDARRLSRYIFSFKSNSLKTYESKCSSFIVPSHNPISKL